MNHDTRFTISGMAASLVAALIVYAVAGTTVGPIPTMIITPFGMGLAGAFWWWRPRGGVARLASVILVEMAVIGVAILVVSAMSVRSVSVVSIILPYLLVSPWIFLGMLIGAWAGCKILGSGWSASRRAGRESRDRYRSSQEGERVIPVNSINDSPLSSYPNILDP